MRLMLAVTIIVTGLLVSPTISNGNIYAQEITTPSTATETPTDSGIGEEFPHAASCDGLAYVSFTAVDYDGGVTWVEAQYETAAPGVHDS